MVNAAAFGDMSDDAFVVSGARRLSHSALRERAARAAAGLAATGVGRDGAVALLLRNDFAVFEAMLAARLVGAFAVPISWNASADDAAYILRDCGAAVLVAHSDLLRAVMSEVDDDLRVLSVAPPPEVRAAYTIDPSACEPPPGIAIWDAWLAEYDPIPVPADGPSAPILYTSGTTGRPKGVRRTGGRRSRGSSKALTVYGLDQPGRTTVLVTGPMYHSVPNAYARLALEAGADIVLQPRFEPEDLLALIERHAITHMHVVPAMMVRLMRLPGEVRQRFDVGSLRHVVHGAAPCPPEVKSAMIEWWGPVIYEYYGSTETGLLTLLDPEAARSRPGTVGRALPGIDLHILDESGRPLPPGETGEIYAGSANLQAFTYLGQDQKRDEIGRGDLVTAGDLGWLDADGFLYLHDRKRDVIQTAGGHLYPAAIEAAILRHEGVRDCAVVGLDGTDDDGVCAFVELVEGATLAADALRRDIRAAVDRPRLTVRVEFVSDFPRQDSGKVFKQALRDRLRLGR